MKQESIVEKLNSGEYRMSQEAYLEMIKEVDKSTGESFPLCIGDMTHKIDILLSPSNTFNADNETVAIEFLKKRMEKEGERLIAQVMQLRKCVECKHHKVCLEMTTLSALRGK